MYKLLVGDPVMPKGMKKHMPQQHLMGFNKDTIEWNGAIWTTGFVLFN